MTYYIPRSIQVPGRDESLCQLKESRRYISLYLIKKLGGDISLNPFEESGENISLNLIKDLGRKPEDPNNI